MRQTKEQFGKTDKRQGYHIILSFAEGEVDAATAFEITGKFAKEYLGSDYEALYTVHDNTDHIHAHIIFNSVSFRTGNKYHYKKGDWAEKIQPVTNRLCMEYGLSVIGIPENSRSSQEDRNNNREWDISKNGNLSGRIWPGGILTLLWIRLQVMKNSYPYLQTWDMGLKMLIHMKGNT